MAEASLNTIFHSEEVVRDLQISLEVEARYTRHLEAQLRIERRRQNMFLSTVCLALGALIFACFFTWIVLARNN